jgi:hypothetical protein
MLLQIRLFKRSIKPNRIDSRNYAHKNGQKKYSPPNTTKPVINDKNQVKQSDPNQQSVNQNQQKYGGNNNGSQQKSSVATNQVKSQSQNQNYEGAQNNQKPGVSNPIVSNSSEKKKIDMIEIEKTGSTGLESMEPSHTRNYVETDPTIAKVKGDQGPNEQSKNYQKEAQFDQSAWKPQQVKTDKDYQGDKNTPNISGKNVPPKVENPTDIIDHRKSSHRGAIEFGKAEKGMERGKGREGGGDKEEREKKISKESYDSSDTNISKVDRKGKVIQGDTIPEFEREGPAIAKGFPNIFKEKIVVAKGLTDISKEKIDIGNPIRDLVHENNLEFVSEEEAMKIDNRRGVDLPKEPTEFSNYDEECSKAIPKGRDPALKNKGWKVFEEEFRNLYFYRNRKGKLIDISLTSPDEKKMRKNYDMWQVFLLTIFSFFCLFNK